MARKRMIDPSIWADEDFGTLSFEAQLFYIGMFSNADDEGRLPGNALYLSSTILPYKNISSDDAVKIRDEIVGKMKSVILYSANGKDYLQFIKWTEYQYIKRPQKSKYPAVPSLYRTSTVQVPPNRKEKKRKEKENDTPKGVSQKKVIPPSSGSLADADLHGLKKVRNAITKSPVKPKPLAILVLILAFFLSGQPVHAKAPKKIVVRYTITTPTNGHKLKPTAHTVAGGIGRGTSTSIPASPTSSASQKPKPSPYPREMGGGEKALAGSVKDRVLAAGVDRFGEEHTSSLEALVMHESGFNQYAGNKSSGACGLFQAMPCEKMGCQLDDVQCQIDWGFGYIERRYGNPTKAWDFWQSRRPINGRDVGNWY